MKTFKIISGAILAIVAINVMITMAGEEQGAGLAGAVTGFIIIGSISAYLLYSGLNSKN
ncbi:hypothetical protein [Flavobacterium cerinum]|uniref:hypothetical protein n=1 Tax=Flavobacterium cerinum TaxID=2502784 RepID=UPI0013E3B7CE|nr:hypothetical protein [Flavobacterium cerinum]